MYKNVASTLIKFLQKKEVSEHAVEAAQSKLVGLLRAWQEGEVFGDEQRLIFAWFDHALARIPNLASKDPLYAKQRLERKFRNLKEYDEEPNPLPLVFLEVVEEAENKLTEEEVALMHFKGYASTLNQYFNHCSSDFGDVAEALRAFAGYLDFSCEAYREEYPIIVSLIEKALEEANGPLEAVGDRAFARSLLRKHIVSMTRLSHRKQRQLSGWALLAEFFAALDRVVKSG